MGVTKVQRMATSSLVSKAGQSPERIAARRTYSAYNSPCR